MTVEIERFFQDELSYLKNQSKIFAEEFPQVAQFLGEKSFDPDVDRTLEGFAYLTGLLQTKTELEYPQLTSSLIDMLWPNYMQPTPSMTIVEFSAQTAGITAISRGAEIQSHHQKADASKGKNQQDKLPCTFKIAREIHVLPLSIEAITLPNPVNNNTIIIDFTVENGATLSDLVANPIRCYLGDNTYTSSQLYLWLNNYLESVKLITDDLSLSQPEFTVTPVGFEQEDAILFYPKNTYMGYRLLQEYFCFPEGFLFVDFLNLTLPPKAKGDFKKFSLELTFSRSLPTNVKLRQNSLKLNCAPAINLFYFDCEPIILDGHRTHYPLVTSYQYTDHFEVFAIDSVNSWLASQKTQKSARMYHSFESFTHQTVLDKGNVPLYYKIERRNVKNSDHIRYFISFVRGDETEVHSYEETVSIRLICTNKDDAAKLSIGELCVPVKGIPDSVTCQNISRPSITLRPNIDQSQHWTTISTLSLNYLSLLNKQALAQILRNYNFSARYSKQAESTLLKMINGIEQFDTEPVQQLHQNLYIKGLQSTLHITQSAFNSEGDLYLFGSILAHFYSLFATVNSFHNLIIINATNQEKYVWPAQIN